MRKTGLFTGAGRGAAACRRPEFFARSGAFFRFARLVKINILQFFLIEANED